MHTYFQVIYKGRSYSLNNRWHKLDRERIEYAIDLMLNSTFDTLTEALTYVTENS